MTVTGFCAVFSSSVDRSWNPRCVREFPVFPFLRPCLGCFVNFLNFKFIYLFILMVVQGLKKIGSRGMGYCYLSGGI